MNLRIEFAPSKSANFAWVLRLCKKHGTLRLLEEEGMQIYSVEFEHKDFSAFRAIYNRVMGWRGTAFYLDDKLMSAHDLFFRVNAVESARRRQELARASRLINKLLPPE